LAEIVVELARDEAPFFFFRGFELAMELGEVVVGGSELDVPGFDVADDVIDRNGERCQFAPRDRTRGGRRLPARAA
jgi:hypothetical protein